jgi:hypothetical protein
MVAAIPPLDRAPPVSYPEVADWITNPRRAAIVVAATVRKIREEEMMKVKARRNRILKQRGPVRDGNKKYLKVWWGTIVNVMCDVGEQLQGGRVKTITITVEDEPANDPVLFSGFVYRVETRRKR